MKILVTGNLGYIGPVLGKRIKDAIEGCQLIGLDSGIFMDCITCDGRIGDSYYDNQIYKDVREINSDDLKGVDCVISLAAVSNDPIGKDFSIATREINYESNIRLYQLCAKQDVKKLVIASSCSVYGEGGENARDENCKVNPISEYAKSKIDTELDLQKLSSKDSTKCIFLRFSTACGASDRLRLDLVLNDFVASAITKKEINVLSDGSPWRPLIDVKDMADAMIWASSHQLEEGKSTLTINVGSNDWNFQISDLAQIWIILLILKQSCCTIPIMLQRY